MADEADYLDGWLRRRINQQVEAALPALVEKEMQRRAAVLAKTVANGVCVCQTCGSVLSSHPANGSGAPLSVAEIIQLAATEYGVPVRQILSHSRTRENTRPRQAAMYLARQTGISATIVGRVFNRDHTTVLAAVRAVEGRMRYRADEAARIAQLTAQVIATAALRGVVGG